MILEYFEVVGKCIDCVFSSVNFDCEKEFGCKSNTIFEFGNGRWDGKEEVILELQENKELELQKNNEPKKKETNIIAKYEEKFIVINKKHLEELEKSVIWKPLVSSLKEALDDLCLGLPLQNKYYVCNQDEPYAQKVIDIILEGEDAKNL